MQSPRQPTIADILADLPKLREIALRPSSQNPMLAALLQQAAALDQIAGWAAACQQVADTQAPPAETPAESSNGHAEDAVSGEVVDLAGGRKKGGS